MTETIDGKQWWTDFAKKHGIEWEEGPPRPRDQHGTEYDTWRLRGWYEEARLARILQGVKYVVIRMYPHRVTHGRDSLIRMRFSIYANKPAQVTT